jgi:hypothetical protein
MLSSRVPRMARPRSKIDFFNGIGREETVRFPL